MTHWEAYEQIAAGLLNDFSSHFGLDRVEGKQKLPGQNSGTTWEVDAKGVRDSDGAIIVVECRRYLGRKINQEAVAGLAYRIADIGAKGGIVVSPLELQMGARNVADAEQIVSVQLDANSTPTDFAMRFLGRLLLGASVEFRLGVSIDSVVEVFRMCEFCHQRFVVVENEHRCPKCEQISSLPFFF